MASAKAFVGRHREIDELTSALTEVRAGQGSLFIVVGGAGMGKTRLCDEVTREARAAGFQTVWGRCWETGGAPAYWPFIQVLRELVRGEGRAALAAAGASTQLGQLIPDLMPPASDGEGTGAVVPSDPADARFRLFDAVTAVLREAAVRTPLLVVLDDLHTADPSSLALLHFVARNLRGIRALVLCTYRDEEARLHQDTGKVLADVAREGTYLPLGPLSRDDVAALVGPMAGHSADPSLVEEIRRTTEGNPLFLDQLLRLLVQRGDFAAGGVQPGRLPVPETVRDVIRRRASRLGAATVELLAIAAVLGREWHRSTLLALVEHSDEAGASVGEAIDAAIVAAEQAALLSSVDEGRWRFSHVLVGETLYRDLPAQRRADLHLRVAGSLETSGGDALAEIAHHRLAALPAGDVVVAAQSARRAADHAAGMLAFEDAAALLEQAHAGLQAAHVGNARLSCELWLAAGFARMRGGDITRGRALCEAAAQEARRLGDGDLFARCALGYGAEIMIARSEETLLRLLTESLTVLPEGPSGLRAQVMARLAAARQPCVDALAPVAMAREAVGMARAVGAPSDVLREVLFSAGGAMADYADPAERASVSEELVDLARAASDRSQMLRAQGRLVFDYLEMGELEECRLSVSRYDELARAFGQARHLWPARLMRAMVAAGTGNFADAERFTSEARGLVADDRDMMSAGSMALAQMAFILQAEKPAQIPAVLAELEGGLMVPPLEQVGRDIFNSVRATLLARLTDDRDEVARTLATLVPDTSILRHDYAIMSALGEAVLMVGHQRLAQSLYQRLLPEANRIANFGRVGFYCWGPVEAGLGLMAATLGRVDEARSRFARAAEVTDRMGLRPGLAHIRFWQARLEAGPGGAGGEAALPFLQQAEALAKQMALPVLITRLQSLRAGIEAGRAAPVSAPWPAPPRALTVGDRAVTLVREGEYWTLTAAAGTTRLKDTRGVQMLAELIANPGREFHALSLMGSDGGADEGDAGELLDGDAIASYRDRVEVLDDEISEAESWGDAARLARARAEREAIADELSRGVGLGGRVRRGGSSAERARVNVQRRIRGAIRKIALGLPETAAYLDRAVRTGAFCAYEPH